MLVSIIDVNGVLPIPKKKIEKGVTLYVWRLLSCESKNDEKTD